MATGVVETTTGMLLTYETTDRHPPEVLDLLAGTTLDLFQGRTVTMIEDIFKSRGLLPARSTTSRKSRWAHYG
ncbi:hypothetical protein ALI144C_32635 [Actinosynnema sp. ALI-1.44]|uniref:hypothetical protein n=1 Tax=Actinosynnema sp. ALI-1.44 TaxID=1933779 RepID=UPI00097CA4AE|nr:hypothetical protein [Actinosynnema sp. ALI-1.44]ONI76885.1 hypothetical protein ALI144C_32635 [Actinosynnema sp. ALI-1.44]